MKVDEAPTERASDAPSIVGAALKAQVKSRLFGGEVEAVQIGRFSIERAIGAGGMGVVYEGRDPELGRRVAIKLLRTESEIDAGRERLQREAQALARLSHPNVVQVYEVGSHDGDVFVAMEFVEGQTLRAWAGAEPRKPSAILDVMVQAGRGLEAAHAAELVHRDFKPENVLVADDGRVRVLDFGLARPVDESVAESARPSKPPVDDPLRTPLTQTGTMMGTPAYMAPEQHAGQPTDARTDQFSYCVTLYELLVGERPFQGDSLPELRDQVTQGPAPRLTDLAGVPTRVREAIGRGLAKDPADRFPSMTELLAELAPRTGRRGTIVLASAVVVASVVGVAVVAGNQPAATGPACVASAERVANTWDEASKTEIHAAIMATHEPSADDAWQAFERAMDERVTAWRSVYDTTCEQADASQAGRATLEQRRECLDHAFEEIAIVSEIMRTPDARTVRVAAEAPSGLLDVQLCADDRAIAAFSRPPDGADRQRFAELRGQISRANLLASVGAEQDAKTQLEKLVEELTTTGWTGLESEARLRLADQYYRIRMRSSLARDADARTLNLPIADQLDAGFAASQRGGHDVLAARLAAMRALIATHEPDAKRIEPSIELADALIARTGDDEARLRLELARGRQAVLAADFDGAAARFLQVRESAVALHRTDLVADAWRIQVRALVGEPTRVVAIAGQAAAWVESTYGVQHPDAVAFRQREIESDDSRDKIRAYCDIDRAERHMACSELYHSVDEWPPAIRHAALAVETARASGERGDGLVATLSWLGHLHLDGHDPQAAQAPLEEALARFREDDAARPLTLDLAASLVRAYSGQGKHEDAIRLARETRESTPDEHWFIEELANAYLDASRAREALPLVEPLEAFGRRAIGLRRGEIFVIAAKVLWEAGQDRARARKLLAEARALWTTDATNPWALRRIEELDAWLAERRVRLPRAKTAK